MKGFKDQSFAERRKAAAVAKQSTLDRFRARPGIDDPAVVARRADRQAIAAAREARAKEREAARIVEAAEEAARARDEEENRKKREEQEATEQRERQAALESEQKAARDARYAARKARKRSGEPWR